MRLKGEMGNQTTNTAGKLCKKKIRGKGTSHVANKNVNELNS